MAVELTDEQRSAVENRGGELLVSAAAGAGKTRVLVERLMSHVERGEDIDRFLVITFTNAAAAELRDRIAGAIHERLANAPNDRHLRRSATLVYQAPICTIDAFCLDFLRVCGPAAGLESDLRLCDEAEGQELARQALETVLERRYAGIQDDPGFEALVDALAGDRDDQRLEEVVLDIHRRVQSHPEPLRWLEEEKARWALSPETGLEDTVWGRTLMEDARALAGHWREPLSDAREEARDNAVVDANYGQSMEVSLTCLDHFLHGLSEGWDSARRCLPIPFPPVGRKRKDCDTELQNRVKKVRAQCKGQLEKLAERFEVSSAEAMEDLMAIAPAMSALLDTVADYDREFSALKARRRVMDFADGEHWTARLLADERGEPTPLAVDWSERYREIMVDEYQDTNAVQNVIFHALSRGDNLFLVGDVKQSIYRFRLADPGIFLDKYARFAPHQVAEEGEGRTILLSRNFRSRPEVLEGVNFIFRNVMTEAVGEMDYTEQEALIPGREGVERDERFRVEINCVDLSQLTAVEEGERADKDLVEARAAAARIAGLLAQGLPVGDRPLRPDDIVILLRSPGPVLWAYAQALGEANIPWQAEGGEEFFHTTEISVAISLLQAVDNPRQDVALLAALRSPVFGFTPDRLASLRAACPGTVYEALRAGAERGEKDCGDFLHLLGELRALAAEESSHRLLWYIYQRTDLLAIFSAMSEGERRRDNLLALHDAARRFEQMGHKGLFGFLRHLARTQELGRELPVARRAGGGVRILSIHRSKGLEFPVVLLCGLERQFNDADARATILFHERLGLGPKRTDRRRMVRYTTVAREAVALRLRRQLRAEEQRLLYVAMTRAEHKLILFAAVNGRGSKLDALREGAQCPPSPQLVGEAASMLPWVMLPVLCRPESGPLWEGEGERPDPPSDSGTAWDIRLLPAGDWEKPLRPMAAPAPVEDGGDGIGEEELTARLAWQYPHGGKTDMPSKLTATQLKGRAKDSEAEEEGTPMPPAPTRVRALRRPILEGERPLSAAERGTALHMAMQYLDFAKTGSEAQIREEIARLTAGQFITAAQGAAVDADAILTLFGSPLGRRIRSAPRLEREFKFSMLVPAQGYYEDGGEEELLLQGVVDCWFEEADGTVTVVDFKSDAVTEATVEERAARYRPQLEAYTRALEEILDARVGRRVLWFFTLGREIAW